MQTSRTFGLWRHFLRGASASLIAMLVIGWTSQAQGNLVDGKQEKLTVPPGPNNPVGSTWIDLTRDTYGIHGAPDPRLVGKVASHGCVRLTNWDAHELGAAVKKGTTVVFSGQAVKGKV